MLVILDLELYIWHVNSCKAAYNSGVIVQSAPTFWKVSQKFSFFWRSFRADTLPRPANAQCRSLCMRVNQAKPNTTVNPDHERVVRCLCNWCNSLSPSSGDGICEEDLQILTCQAAAQVPITTASRTFKLQSYCTSVLCLMRIYTHYFLKRHVWYKTENHPLAHISTVTLPRNPS